MATMNQRKEKLGIAHSVARYKLAKLILFNLLVKHEENVCYRCKNIIDKIEDLSIDHKESWYCSKNPIELFYDMNNIAFSHLSCNKAAGADITNEIIRNRSSRG